MSALWGEFMSQVKPVDWEKVDNMLIAGCNGVECAAAIGLHPDTLYDKCRDEKGTVWTLYLQEKRSHGDGMLRAAQYQKAIKEKNSTKLIWLGKQRLNQNDGEQTISKKNLAELKEALLNGEIRQKDTINTGSNNIVEILEA